MADRTRLADSDLERLLVEYGAEAVYPPVPDIAAAVERRLAPNGRHRAVSGTGPLHIAATPPRGKTAPPVGGVREGGLLDVLARPRRSRQMLEMATGLLVFAIVAGVLALVFGGFDPGSSETGGAPASLAAEYDLYVLDAGDGETVVHPVNSHTLVDRTDLQTTELEGENSYYSGDGSIRVTVDPPLISSITVSDGVTGEEIASFEPPGDIADPRLSDDGSRLVVSTRYVPGATTSSDWYVLDTSDGSILSGLRVDDVTTPEHAYINSDATRLYRIVPPELPAAGAEPGPLEIISYDLTTGAMLARTTIPDLAVGFSPDDLQEADDIPLSRSEPGIALSPDDRQLAIISGDARRLVVLDAATLEIERDFDLETSDQGRIEGLLTWLNILSREAAAKQLLGPSRDAVIHPDGQYLYSYGFEGVEDGPRHYRGLGLMLVDMATGEIAAQALAEEEISWVIPAPDGESIYAGGYGKFTGNGAIFPDSSPFTIRRLDAATLEVLAEREFDGYRRIVIDRAPDLTSDEDDQDRLYTVGVVHGDEETIGGRVAAYDARSGVQVYSIEVGSSVDATLSADGRRLFIADDSLLIAIDAASGRELWHTAIENRTQWILGLGPSTLASSSHGEHVYVYGGDYSGTYGDANRIPHWVDIFDGRDGEKIGRLDAPNCPAELRPSPDGRTLYVVCLNRGSSQAVAIDLTTSEPVSDSSLASATAGAVATAVSGDGETLYVVRTSAITVIDMVQRRILAEAPIDFASPPARLLRLAVVSTDNQRLFVGLTTEVDESSGAERSGEIMVLDTTAWEEVDRITMNIPVNGPTLAGAPDPDSIFAVQTNFIPDSSVPSESTILRLRPEASPDALATMPNEEILRIFGRINNKSDSADTAMTEATIPNSTAEEPHPAPGATFDR